MTYSIVEPHESGLMDTGDGHQVYWEVAGSPQGKPAVVLHGGPGSGATPWWRQFFDPARYRVVLMDQRGCGRSRPNAGEDCAALNNNTTRHLICDLEALRKHLGIEQWLVFGASWGSTLGLAYAIEHPERISELVLWSVVTTREREVHWLTHVMGDVFPEEFDQLRALLPVEERNGNIPAAINALLMSDNPDVCDRAASAWCAWEDRLSTLTGPVQAHPRSSDGQRRLGFARLVTHYFGNHAFLADDAINGNLTRLAGIPTYLLRGRLDIASPLRSAYEVAQKLPNATLDIVESEAHGAGDDTMNRLVAVLDSYATNAG